MTAFDERSYSAHFAFLAAKLERHLRKNGVSCNDADMIIEESSVLYFKKLDPSIKFPKVLKNGDPIDVFIESAQKVMAIRLPEATDTFGAKAEIAKALH